VAAWEKAHREPPLEADELLREMDAAGVGYRQAVTMFTEEMPWLSADDLDWIMGRSLSHWLGWEAPTLAKRTSA
jgi:hypothetical protein